MKKIIAIFISGLMIISLFIPASALTSKELSHYTAYCDFENINNFSNDYFSIIELTDDTHGKVLKRKGTWGHQLEACGTYTLNDSSVNTFKEPIKANTNYIFSFEYKYLDDGNGDKFSFAPKVDEFASGKSFRNFMPVRYEWTEYSHVINSGSLTNMGVQINSTNCTNTFYIDNYSLIEAFQVSVDGFDGVNPNFIEGDFVDGFVPKGGYLKFSAPKGFSFTVTMGDVNYPEEAGYYIIPSVDADISISASLDTAFVQKETNIPIGTSVREFKEFCALPKDSIQVYDQNDNLKNVDEFIQLTDTLTIPVSSTESQDFNFNFMADNGNDSKYTVSDLLCIVDEVLKDETDIYQYDINKDGYVSVTDVVKMRKVALKMKEYTIDSEKLASEVSKIELDAYTYGITDEMLSRSIANVGDRSRLANVMKKALNGETITFAALGGSITYGSQASNREKTCYAALVSQWFERMFPGQVKFVNAGIPGTGSQFGRYRLKTDVLAFNPDVLIVEFAVNDGKGNVSSGTAQESIIRTAYKNDIAVMQLFMTSNSAGANCGQYTHGPTGIFYGVPQISMKDAFWGQTFTRSNGQTMTFSNLLADGTHPNDMGYLMTATLINNYLNSVYENLNSISYKVPEIPGYHYETAEFYENLKVYDFANATGTKDVEIVSYGGFTKNSSGGAYLSKMAPFYGVSAANLTVEPLVLNIKNCHTFSLISQTANFGANVKVEVYRMGTDELIFSSTSNFTSGSGAIRTHDFAYQNVLGADITVKLSPYLDSSRNPNGKTLDLRGFSVS